MRHPSSRTCLESFACQLCLGTLPKKSQIALWSLLVSLVLDFTVLVVGSAVLAAHLACFKHIWHASALFYREAVASSQSSVGWCMHHPLLVGSVKVAETMQAYP